MPNSKLIKRSHTSLSLLPLTLLAAAIAMCAASCNDSKRETISISADPETFPTMKTLNVSTTISDSGYTRYHITTPLWLMFEEAAEPHWDFPKGVFLLKLDNDMKDNATFTADTAVYYSQKRLWRFDRNVRMRNVNGDRFVTQQLFWDQNQHKIYSDSFIHIERSDRILEGHGFDANEAMTTYTIRRPSAILPTGAFGAHAAEE